MSDMSTESVDLICTDPPFNSNKDWIEFNDKWDGGLQGYLHFIRPRIQEMHRVLKSTGCIYLHCDKNTSHYLKIMLDKIFGSNNFLNEIIWSKRFGHANDVKKKFATLHDTIFLYSKSNTYKFNPSYRPLCEEYIKSTYKHIDKDGRKYRINPSCKLRKGNQKGRTYLDENKGTSIGSLWTEPELKLSSFSQERTGYPTQKPISLYKRMINASSEEGDLILDPFCGSGTTLIAAKILNRKWIGIDKNPNALKITSKRLSETTTQLELKSDDKRPNPGTSNQLEINF